MVSPLANAGARNRCCDRAEPAVAVGSSACPAGLAADRLGAADLSRSSRGGRLGSCEPLALLQAAYHLGNRHVALELNTSELRLLEDPVLEAMLRQRGLKVDHVVAPFQPEAGAYSAAAHHHR